jgi:hypothetical protein
LGIAIGPFADPGSASAILAGMLCVAAMATQGATNTTQLAVDLAPLVRRRGELNELAQARHRAKVIFPCVAGFVIGGVAGAFLEVHLQLAALAMPVLLAALAVPLGEVWSDGRSSTLAAGVISFPNQQTLRE